MRLTVCLLWPLIGCQEEASSLLTITGVLRSDLVGPIFCSVANKLEMEKSAPFNLTVYCKYCAPGDSSHAGSDMFKAHPLKKKKTWLSSALVGAIH